MFYMVDLLTVCHSSLYNSSKKAILKYLILKVNYFEKERLGQFHAGLSVSFILYKQESVKRQRKDARRPIILS